MSSSARTLHLVSSQASAPTWLAGIARRLAAEPDVWAPRVRHDPRQRFYERLIVADSYDAWLVGWSPGQAIPVHDHGSSAGAVVVTEGSLVETAWPDGAVPVARTLGHGDEPLVFGPDHVHAMANLASRVATSIHVYSPALQSMGWFAEGIGAEGADAERFRREDPIEQESSHARTVEIAFQDARSRLRRVLPEEARIAAERGAVFVDIRPEAFRKVEGALPGAVVVERNVLEWRLDPTSPDRLPQVIDHDTPIVLVCNEGYASALAAVALQDLGLVNATDLDGGFRAWIRAGLPVALP